MPSQIQFRLLLGMNKEVELNPGLYHVYAALFSMPHDQIKKGIKKY